MSLSHSLSLSTAVLEIGIQSRSGLACLPCPAKNVLGSKQEDLSLECALATQAGLRLVRFY